jgi:hypothetical protein
MESTSFSHPVWKAWKEARFICVLLAIAWLIMVSIGQLDFGLVLPV